MVEAQLDSRIVGGADNARLFERSAAAQRRLHELVPGGAHTYARVSWRCSAGLRCYARRVDVGQGARERVRHLGPCRSSRADGGGLNVMERQGRKLAAATNSAASDAGVAEHVSVVGRPSGLVFVTSDAHGTRSQEFRTLFLQELLRRGVLGESFVISAAHANEDIEQTVDAVAAALVPYRKALEPERPRAC